MTQAVLDDQIEKRRAERKEHDEHMRLDLAFELERAFRCGRRKEKRV